ncbi:MAG: quinolinate synthase NadA [Armatimonadetes bacterium]|nr:quinolinate synthase NadA [Armatimonadota bacterium]
MPDDVTAALHEELARLREERKAVLLVHNYQNPAVQDIADFRGDSLGLSRQAAATDAETIVFCGVHFMAQTAKLLSPDKLVLLPEIGAGCPMADMITPESLQEFKAKHPGLPVVAYVNTTAEVKAECDVCCTSANAVQVVKSLPDEQILFVPDQYLAHWVAQQVPDKGIIPYGGFCPTHARINPRELAQAQADHPEALTIGHPECPPDVLALCDAVRSTSGMVKSAQESPAREFIIATECGMVYRLQQDLPDKTFHGLSSIVCPNMKKTTLQSVVTALRELQYQIEIPDEVADKARQAVQRMVEIG